MNKKIVENNSENMLDSDSGISLNDFFATYGVKPRYIVADKTKDKKTEDGIPWGRKGSWTKEKALEVLADRIKQRGKQNFKVYAEFDISKTPLAVFDDDLEPTRSYEEMVKQYPELEGGMWCLGNTKGFHIMMHHDMFINESGYKDDEIDDINHRDLINNIIWFDIAITHFNGFAPICADVDKIVDKYLSGFYEKMKQRISTKKKIVDKDKKPMSKKPKNLKVVKNNEERKLIKELLDNIEIKYVDEYPSWRDICSALNCCGCEDMIDDFSSKSSKYNDGNYQGQKDWIVKTTAFSIKTIKMYSRKSNENKHYKILQEHSEFPDITEDMGDSCFVDLFKNLCDDVFFHKERERLFIYDENTCIWREADNWKNLINIFQKYICPYLDKQSRIRMREQSELPPCEKISQGGRKKDKCGCPNCAQDTRIATEITQIKKSLKYIRAWTNLSHIAQLLETTLKCNPVEVELDENPWLFCWDNRTYDILNKKFVDRDRDDYITHTCGYDYVEPDEMDYSHLHAIMKSIHPNDEVRKCYGSILRNGLTRNLKEKVPLANGTGGNGKSMLNEFTGKLLGKYYHTISHSLITKEITDDKPLPAIAGLINARLCIISEIPSKESLMDDSIKKLTNRLINARGMYSSITQILNTAMFILECNSRPKINMSLEVLDSMLRRYLDIEFEMRFTKDPKLIGTGNYIEGNSDYKGDDWKVANRILWFHYLVENYEDEIPEPDVVKERSRKFLNKCDSLSAILDEHFYTDNYSSMAINDIRNVIKKTEEYLNMDKKTKTNLIKVDEIKKMLRVKYPKRVDSDGQLVLPCFDEFETRKTVNGCGKVDCCVWGIKPSEN